MMDNNRLLIDTPRELNADELKSVNGSGGAAAAGAGVGSAAAGAKWGVQYNSTFIVWMVLHGF